MSDPIEAPIRAYVDGFQGEIGRDEALLESQRTRRVREEDLAAETARRLAVLYPGLERMRVLELGSGTGGNSVAIALLGAEADGVEPSAAGVEASRIRAERYPRARARFQVGVGERLPYTDGSFDLVVSFAVLEHVQDQACVAREVFRVLRPGGRIHFEMPNYLYPREEHYRVWYPPLVPKPLGRLYLRLIGKDPAFLDTITYTTPGRMERILRLAGFVDVRDLFRDRSLARIDDPSLIKGARAARWVGRLRRWGLAGPLRALVARGLYPDIHITARRP
ncbi:MAG: methyltransferase domain-containing protein [Planctomycetota bacterium]